MLRVSSNDSVQVFHGIGALRGGLEVISWKGHHLTSFLFGWGIIHPWKRHHKKINRNKISFFKSLFFTFPFCDGPQSPRSGLHEVAVSRSDSTITKSTSTRQLVSHLATLFYRNQSLPYQLIKAIKTVSRDEKFIFRENFSFNLKACVLQMHASFFI